MIKKLILLPIVAIFFGCATTGNQTTDAALTAATGAITDSLISAATKVALGSDIKTALVQSSGDAIRSLEASGINQIQPAINSVLAKWLPKGVDWSVYSKKIGSIVTTYVASHGNNNVTLNAALEAAALALNNFKI